MAGRSGISRVVLIYRPENLAQSVEQFKDALNIGDFEGPYQLDDLGLHVVISWSTGLELIAPMESGAHSASLWDFLEQKGEGMFNLVYRVGNLDEAEARATACGFPRMGERLSCLDVEKSWADRFSLAKEAPLAAIAGIPITLIQIEPLRREAAPRRP